MISIACSIRVQLADDHPVVREGLAAVIDYQDDMEMVGTGANGREALENFRLHIPDVTLMDLRMPEMDGMTAVAAIRAEFPEACIIILTTFGGDYSVVEGLRIGVAGFLLKDAPVADILEAIRSEYSHSRLRAKALH